MFAEWKHPGSTEVRKDTPPVGLCACLQQWGLLWYSHTQPQHQQVQQMQLVAMDIRPAFNFEDVLGYLKNKDVARCFDFSMIANYFFYP